MHLRLVGLDEGLNLAPSQRLDERDATTIGQRAGVLANLARRGDVDSRQIELGMVDDLAQAFRAEHASGPWQDATGG